MAKLRALVTGASAGIGAAYARRLARDGYDLVLVARRDERLSALADEFAAAHGTSTEVLIADLGASADVRRVEARLGAAPPIDLLVNNAGFGVFLPLDQQDPDVIDEMVRVNVTALLRLSRAAVPGMLERGAGTIINVSSGTVFYPMADASIYMATKALILAFTRSLHLDVGARGVRVQAMVPGVVATEFFHRATGVDGSPPQNPAIVMQADDLVEASMAALSAGETVCIPSLPEYGAFRRFEAAELEVLSGVSKDRIAERYRS